MQFNKKLSKKTRKCKKYTFRIIIDSVKITLKFVLYKKTT